MLTALANIGLGVLVVVLITAFTAYFVAQEFAYTAVNRSRLTALAEAGDSAAARALQVTRRTSFMLSGAQLGITVTGLLAGYLAEPLIGSGLAELLGRASVPSAIGVAVGAAVSLIFCTVRPDAVRRTVPEEPRDRHPRIGCQVDGGVHPLVPAIVRLADLVDGPVVEPAVAGTANRAGARRRTCGNRTRSGAHRRRLFCRRGTCLPTCRPCSTGCWISRPAPPSTP